MDLSSSTIRASQSVEWASFDGRHDPRPPISIEFTGRHASIYVHIAGFDRYTAYLPARVTQKALKMAQFRTPHPHRAAEASVEPDTRPSFLQSADPNGIGSNYQTGALDFTQTHPLGRSAPESVDRWSALIGCRGVGGLLLLLFA